MKKIIIITFCISLFTGCLVFNFTNYPGMIRRSSTESAFVQFTNQKERDPELEKLLDEAIITYGGGGGFIIQHMKTIADTYYSTPYIGYYTWISDQTRSRRGESDFEFLLSLDVNTTIHETAHHFSGSAAYLSEYSTSSMGNLSYSAPSIITAVYLEDWGVQYVLQTRTIPATEISELIKNKKLMEDHRYKIYLNDPYHIAQSEGIYGLLDEYHAYHYSLVVSLNIAKENAMDLSKKTEPGQPYYSSFNDIYVSYLQFSVYILTYLRTVEQKYPDIFNELMANHLLIEAILRIHDTSHILYKEYLELLYRDAEIMVDKKYVFQDIHERTLKEYQLPENQEMLTRMREIVKNSYQL